jgi:nitroreductase
VEFRDVVRRRRMVRNYDPDRPVPAEIRERILDHAIRAPSAGFSQGWGFLVLEDAADRERFWQAATPQLDVWQQWLINMRNAPLIIVPHSNKDIYLDRYAQADKGWTDRDEGRWPVPYWDIDTGFASLLMLLTVPASSASRRSRSPRTGRNSACPNSSPRSGQSVSAMPLPITGPARSSGGVRGWTRWSIVVGGRCRQGGVGPGR